MTKYPRHPLPLFRELKCATDYAPARICRGDSIETYTTNHLSNIDKEILRSPVDRTDRVYIELKYRANAQPYPSLALLEYFPRKQAHKSLKLIFAFPDIYAELSAIIAKTANLHMVPCHHCAELFSYYSSFAFVLDAKDPKAPNFCGVKCRDDWALQFQQKELADRRKRH